MVRTIDRISVSVRIPSLDRTQDFIIPENMSVRNVQQLIITILSSEYGVSDRINDTMLFSMKDAEALRLECSLEQLGIVDGSRLILI